MDSNGSLWVFMVPYESVWVLMDPHMCVCIHIGPYRSLLVVISFVYTKGFVCDSANVFCVWLSKIQARELRTGSQKCTCKQAICVLVCPYRCLCV